jgi:8-oxo-dGTP pyrophosphatase MutT (NUDIX family)
VTGVETCDLKICKWDLPKGKLDAGESLETCAVREVQEETGLSAAELKKHLITTYHTYDESGHHILKETWWYLLTAPGNQTLTPQAVEQITQIEWADPADLKKYTSNTYPLVMDVLKTGGYLP